MHFTLIFVIWITHASCWESFKFRIQGMLKCMFDDTPVSDSSCQTRILLLQRNQASCLHNTHIRNLLNWQDTIDALEKVGSIPPIWRWTIIMMTLTVAVITAQRAVVAVGRCPSVRSSVRHVRVCVSTRLKISSNFFIGSVAPSIYSFFDRKRYPIPRGKPSSGALNTRGWERLIINEWMNKLITQV